MEDSRNWKHWEGVHAVPDLTMETCPWCQQERTAYFIVTYERGGQVEAEPVCECCSAAGIHFIAMHKKGLSRKHILEDFGFRDRCKK